MTYIAKNVIHVEPEPDRKCSMCGKVAECRPYGPDGADICFECGEKIPETVEKQMGHRLFGDPL